MDHQEQQLYSLYHDAPDFIVLKMGSDQVNHVLVAMENIICTTLHDLMVPLVNFNCSYVVQQYAAANCKLEIGKHMQLQLLILSLLQPLQQQGDWPVLQL